MTNITSRLVSGVATAVVIGYSGFGEPVLQNDFHYDSKESVNWYKEQHYLLNENDFMSISEQIEVLQQFSSSILNNIKDIDPDYTKLVDEKFWDLV